MAKVKITGHASGSGVITVTAPNTSTDRTITLPDATATLATTAEAFNPDAAQVFNESGADVDFRVESDGNANMLFVNGGNNQVGIGTSSTESPLHIKKFADTNTIETLLLLDCDKDSHRSGKGGSIVFQDISVYANTAEISAARVGGGNASEVKFKLRNTEILSLRSDGRGLSQFTAKAWINFSGTGTIAIQDSHNFSSITDNGAGNYQAHMDVDCASANYAVGSSASIGGNYSAIKTTPTNAGTITLDTMRVNSTTWMDANSVMAIVFGD